jgi:hypothetical protein
VTLGSVLIPIILAKLWSVLPKLFEWPPARSVTHLVERASLLLLVAGVRDYRRAVRPRSLGLPRSRPGNHLAAWPAFHGRSQLAGAARCVLLTSVTFLRRTACRDPSRHPR